MAIPTNGGAGRKLARQAILRRVRGQRARVARKLVVKYGRSEVCAIQRGDTRVQGSTEGKRSSAVTRADKVGVYRPCRLCCRLCCR
jgi:hypothetical protein